MKYPELKTGEVCMSLLLLNIPIIGRPHDLNPASYEDTKKIVREESVKAGISKYGAGKRSRIEFVCDG